jgi:hypothetical protein
VCHSSTRASSTRRRRPPNFLFAPARKLSAELCELVQDYGLVSFMPLAIEVHWWGFGWPGPRRYSATAWWPLTPQEGEGSAPGGPCPGQQGQRCASSDSRFHLSTHVCAPGPLPLGHSSLQDKEALQAVLAQVDKANGALYASLANPQLGLPPEFVYGTAHRWGRRGTSELAGCVPTHVDWARGQWACRCRRRCCK